MRTMIVLCTLALVSFSLPVASAEPACLEAYPWSELCSGDVGGFVDAMDDRLPCEVDECLSTRSGPSVDCVQVYPYSKLCSGDVVGFACAMIRCEIA